MWQFVRKGLPTPFFLLAACGPAGDTRQAATSPAAQRPSILLVTLDTTRADAMGPEAKGIDTPAYNALAARGVWFRQAYAPVPETLPSHTSMLTGLYPAGHGVHENARSVPDHQPRLAEQLQRSGYHTAAFVSSFVLARRFGLAKGFDLYDDELPAGGVERAARETTDRALAHLGRGTSTLQFIWVHYFDPHTPYAPPEPFKTRFAGNPYLGEVAAMDEQLGRLIQAFERNVSGPRATIVVSDHGEGLGDHGELQHGLLLYQSTMHVPMVIIGPGVAAGLSDAPVSIRRVYHTILDWAGLGTAHSLRGSEAEVVLGEAMRPFLQYGWQPQVMAVDGRQKVINSGRRLEVYDVMADPGEIRDLGPGGLASQGASRALADYPLPSLEATPAPETLSEDARRKLASLGYVSAGTPPVVRRDAPRPAEMVHLFGAIEKASGLFTEGRYKEVIPLLETILQSDPYNLDAMLRLATAHSSLGHDTAAVDAFKRAAQIAPQSPDVEVYLALHYARGKAWERAEPMLEQIVAKTPDRLPAVEALARIRERQGRDSEALALRQRIYALRAPTAEELAELGELAMTLGQTPAAIDAFERARTLQGATFTHDLELGVLYLEARRLEEARAALDRVRPTDPAYSMALFKRAQVSVLLNEPDRAQRIEAARHRADATTRELVAKEALFRSGR